MTYKHIGFSESIVMRELEKIAHRTNLIKNDPEPIEKTASVKLASSDDLFLDSITLASALREKGFVKQAEKLEQKALQYKIANKDAQENQYDWWQEDGKTLIDHCHQPDDYEEIPSSKGYGIVENQNEIKKLIEQVMKKQPLGKAGSQSNELVVMAINALAQQSSNTFPTTTPPKAKATGKLSADAPGESSFVSKLKETYQAKPANFNVTKENWTLLKETANKIGRNDIKALFNKITNCENNIKIINNNWGQYKQIKPPSKEKQNIRLQPISDIEGETLNYNNLVNIINKAIDDNIELNDSIKNDFRASHDHAISRLDSLKSNYIEDINKGIKTFCDQTNEAIDNITNTLKDDSLLFNINENNQKINDLNKSIGKFENIQNYLISGKTDPIATINYTPDWSIVVSNAKEVLEAINEEEVKRGNKPIKEASDYLGTLDKINSSISVKAGLEFFNKMNNDIQEYINAFSATYKEDKVPSNIKRIALEYKNITKEAFLPAGAKAAPTAGTGAQQAGTSKKEVSGKILSSDATNSIAKMQTLLKELATKSTTTPSTKFLSNTLNLVSRDEDGVWGTNTQKALEAARKMVKGDVDSTLLDPRTPASQEDDDKIITRAENNTKAIMQIMVFVFAEDRYAEQAYQPAYLDIIPKSLNEFGLEETQGSIKIKSENLRSLYSLKKLLTGNNFVIQG